MKKVYPVNAVLESLIRKKECIEWWLNTPPYKLDKEELKKCKSELRVVNNDIKRVKENLHSCKPVIVKSIG